MGYKVSCALNRDYNFVNKARTTVVLEDGNLNVSIDCQQKKSLMDSNVHLRSLLQHFIQEEDYYSGLQRTQNV
jgi:hypothetical protein